MVKKRYAIRNQVLTNQVTLRVQLLHRQFLDDDSNDEDVRK